MKAAEPGYSGCRSHSALARAARASTRGRRQEPANDAPDLSELILGEPPHRGRRRPGSERLRRQVGGRSSNERGCGSRSCSPRRGAPPRPCPSTQSCAGRAGAVRVRPSLRTSDRPPSASPRGVAFASNPGAGSPERPVPAIRSRSLGRDRGLGGPLHPREDRAVDGLRELLARGRSRRGGRQASCGGRGDEVAVRPRGSGGAPPD